MLRHLAALRAFNRLPEEERRIVFYSEGAQDWVNLGPVVHELEELGHRVSYLTSDASELARGRPNTFCIGSGPVRTVLFRTLRARVLVMTMTDLGTFQLKRSAHPVHYVHLCHYVFSMHMAHRKGAHAAYDTILCAGPHQERELRRGEELYGFPAKRLVPHGYGRLDAILREVAASRPQPESRRVVLAPSWGPCSFLENGAGEKMIPDLLRAGFHVTLRMHPMTVREKPQLRRDLLDRFGGSGAFDVVTDMSERESLYRSQLMVSDWSSAAFDYAFGLERPVLSIDTPPKVRNPDFEAFGIEPIEVALRSQIGASVPPDDSVRIVAEIERLSAEADAYRERLRSLRSQWVYNVGCSDRKGAEAIAAIAAEEGVRATADRESQGVGAVGAHRDSGVG